MPSEINGYLTVWSIVCTTQQPCKRPLWGESTLCYKGPFMRKARIVYRLVSQLNNCQCKKSSGWLSWRRYLSRVAHNANWRHPDDITEFWASHLDDLAWDCGLCGLDLRLCHSARQNSLGVQDNSRLYAQILGHMLIHTAVFVWATLSRYVKHLLKYSWDLRKHATESYPPTKYHTLWPTTDTGRQDYDIWVFLHFKNRYTQIHSGIEMATYLGWKSRPHPNQVGDKQPQT